MKLLVPPTLHLATTVSMPVLEDFPESCRAPLGEARHVLMMYGRKFAGKPRAARDVRLLLEMAGRLSGLRAEVREAPGEAESVARARCAIESHLAIFATECAEIERAFGAAAPADRMRWAVERLDEQLWLYRRLFEGRPRLAGRPSLLSRSAAAIADVLAAIEDPAIAALRDPLLETCKRRGRAQIEKLEAERTAALRLVASVPRPALVEALVAEAELVHAEFGRTFEGKPRASVPLGELDVLCDRLGELELYLGALSRGCGAIAAGSEALPGVQRLLEAYETEYRVVAARKAEVARGLSGAQIAG